MDSHGLRQIMVTQYLQQKLVRLCGTETNG